MTLGFVCLALLAGTSFAVQASVNANLAKGLGNEPIVATLVSFSVGTMLLLGVTLARGGLGQVLAQVPKQPMWTLTGGALGCLALFSTVFLTPRLGLANMLMLIIFAQLSTAIMLDHAGWLGLVQQSVTPVKAVGLGCMLVGVILVLQGDKWLANMAG
ncbi:MAG TPA: DMT family transporter [Alcanivoracaceae bacterium]|nr:DMT family transporter [Alcanivoracaceae bacterium]